MNNTGFPSRLATALAVLECAGAIAAAADTHPRYTLFWKQRTDVGSPGPRYGHALAYDSDRGVTVFAATSAGELIDPRNAFNAIRHKLAKLQKRLARKVKFSSHWTKLKGKISRLRMHEANRPQIFPLWR